MLECSGHLQIVPDAQEYRARIVGQAIDQVRPEGGQIQPRAGDDRRHASPAVCARNGHPVNVGLLDSGKSADRLRHLEGADVLALPTEGVANPIDEKEIALLVLSHQVARPEPRVSGLEHVAQDLGF